MAVEPLLHDSPVVRLRPAAPADAAAVASWIRSPGELYWLAPRTFGPLTQRGVIEWWSDEREPLVMEDAADGRRLAYGELNLLDRTRGSFWLGHLIVPYELRGRGHGRRLVREMLRHAFHRRAARRVTLVVFPGNTAAIRSYLAAGMRQDGYESHFFATRRRREKLLRLAIEIDEWVDHQEISPARK